MVFRSDRQRKAMFARINNPSRRDKSQPVMQEKKPEPTFRIVKVKGQVFVQRTIKTKKGKIIQRRPI